MYFLRLAKLKPAVEEIAAEAWGDMMVSLSQQPSENTVSEMLSISDSRRKRQARRPSSGCKTGRALLGGWDGLHGYAIETQYSR